MNTLRTAALTLVMAATIAVSYAGGQKTPGYLVTFHLQGEETDLPQTITPVKLGSEAKQYYFQKMPSFSDKDIAWFYPFTAQDGYSFGVAFRLRPEAADKLTSLTIANQRKLLGMRVMTAPLKAVRIDRPVEDGILVMWDGLTKEHLAVLGTQFRHVEDFKGGSEPSFNMTNTKKKAQGLFSKTKQQAQQTADNVTLPTPSKPARPAGGLFSGFKKKNAGSASPVNPYANPQ